MKRLGTPGLSNLESSFNSNFKVFEVSVRLAAEFVVHQKCTLKKLNSSASFQETMCQFFKIILRPHEKCDTFNKA